MKFEFDKKKSKSNKEKHGIDFFEAQNLFEDKNLIIVNTKCESEPRYLTIGKINNKFWTMIITYRRDNIRIISVRRSRKEEIGIYENPKKYNNS